MSKLLTYDDKPSRKEYVVFQAFKLFLTENVEKVTIPELEKRMGKTRGAIFHHVRDKNTLFCLGIDSYFFSKINLFYPISYTDDIQSLKDYISCKEKHLSEVFAWFEAENIGANAGDAAFNITLQAKKYYPDFQKKYLEFIQRDIAEWTKSIEKGVLVKELKADTDINQLVSLFRATFIGACFDGDSKSLENIFNPVWTLYNVVRSC